MKDKLDTISNLFDGNEIRSVLDSEKEDYYFSVIDVVSVLTESNIPKRYWTDLKRKLVNEGSQLYDNIVRLKMKSIDGKFRETDTLDTEGIFRLIESIPSPKAEPFKMWLASLGKERIDEFYDPEKAIKRAINYYYSKGYTSEWILVRLKAIINRNKLTNVWYENGITKEYECAILTNEIYKTWSGMNSKQYKRFKDIKKESLRDNMSDIEILLTDLGEVTTRDIVLKEHPKGLKENIYVAKKDGNVSKKARDCYEQVTGNKAITKNNNIIKYIYI